MHWDQCGADLALLASMRRDVASVFFQALALSGLLAVLPLSLLWFLERRERQTPWLFAAAFLWGGCIATALALPFNTAFLKLVDTWVVLHPVVREILGPDAADSVGRADFRTDHGGDR